MGERYVGAGYCAEGHGSGRDEAGRGRDGSSAGKMHGRGDVQPHG
jgi:hypothetical protein